MNLVLCANLPIGLLLGAEDRFLPSFCPRPSLATLRLHLLLDVYNSLSHRIEFHLGHLLPYFAAYSLKKFLNAVAAPMNTGAITPITTINIVAKAIGKRKKVLK